MSALIALVGAYGVHLVYSSVVLGWRGVGPGPRRSRPPGRRVVADWLTQAGLADVPTVEVVAVLLTVATLGAALGVALVGGPVAAVVGAVAGAAVPTASFHRRRRSLRQESREAWPRLIEEIRLLVGSVGRSVPEASIDAGVGGPPEIAAAFRAARREWRLTTEYSRALDAVRDRLADATADAVCETLLVAHEVGGTDIDRRLAALAADRRRDAQARRDAHARLAGVRFARRFTLLVPLGMAAAGMAIGTGRDAYATPEGQLLIAAGSLATAACWWWAGRIMHVPDERRVFTAGGR